jgi:mannose-1-phosphate guanylyltransferase
MKALILAAGYGSRLRPLTNSVPKCLVEINGIPLLEYWLKMMVAAEIEDVLINLHYLPEKVLSYLNSCNIPLNIKTVYEKTLLSTGGTLLRNSEYFGNDPVMMIHADNYSIFNPKEFIQTYNSRDRDVEITMMTFEADAPEECGVVIVDSRNRVIEFYEKISNPPSNLANAAVYIVSNQVINDMRSLNKEVIDFSKEIIPQYLGKINTFKNNTYHRDIGTSKSLEQARIDQILLKNKV